MLYKEGPRHKKKKKGFLVSPKLQVCKNKLVVRWTGGPNSSSDGKVQRTRSMPCGAGDAKGKLSDSNTESKKSGVTGKVKHAEKKPETGEDIMQQFPEQKSNEKWNFFVNKLGKKDSDMLR